MLKKTQNKFALEINNISHYFQNRWILRNLSLNIKTGEFVTIVGPSGSGKSTLLNLILGAFPPSKGTIAEFGENKIGASPHCGIVYQKYPLYPHLTVKENIIFGLTQKEQLVDKKSQEKKALAYLSKVNLKEAQDKYPFELSGGMQQRVAIIQTIIANPSIILFDEPFSALDFSAQATLQQLLLDLYQKEKKTIIFITHNVEEAIFLGSRIIVLGEKENKQGATIIFDKKINEPYPRKEKFKTSSHLNEILKKIYNLKF